MVDVSRVGERESISIARIARGLSMHQGISEWEACRELAGALILEATIRFFRPYEWDIGKAEKGKRPIVSRSLEHVRAGEAAVSTALLAVARDERWNAKSVTFDAPDGREASAGVDEVHLYRDQIETVLRRKGIQIPVRWPDIATNKAKNTVKGAAACGDELLELMRKPESRPAKPKSAYKTEFCRKYDISGAAFMREWTKATEASENENWGRPGRPKKSISKIDQPK